jgi:hypothetical protein
LLLNSARGVEFFIIDEGETEEVSTRGGGVPEAVGEVIGDPGGESIVR